MKVYVKAKIRAKEEHVEQLDETHFVVAVKERPTDGKANAAIGKAIARHFQITVSQVRLTSGGASRFKTFEIRP